MRNTCLSWPLVKRNYILSIDEVCPILRTNFDSKQNEGYKCFFSQNLCINIMYTNEHYPFVLDPREKKLDSIHGWSSSRFKDKLWFQTKWRQQIFFRKTKHQYYVSQWELSICLGPSWKKLDPIHRRSSSRFNDKLWFQLKRRLQILFCQTNTLISCIPMITTQLFFPPMKRKYILSTDEVCPVLRANFDSKQNDEYKCFFGKTNASISYIPMRTTHLS